MKVGQGPSPRVEDQYPRVKALSRAAIGGGSQRGRDGGMGTEEEEGVAGTVE